MDEKQLERVREALEHKNKDAREASKASRSPHPRGASPIPEQPELHEHGRPQDTRDPRTKSAGHGKKTADRRDNRQRPWLARWMTSTVG
jgi:hypothetical protein